MAIEKYIVAFDEVVIALKYDVLKSKVTIGGSFRFKNLISRIIIDAFLSKKVLQPIWIQTNKIKYVFRKSENEFRIGLQWMHENGFTVEQTKRHGNIMR